MNRKIRWIDDSHKYTEWFDIDEVKVPEKIDYVEVSEIMTQEEAEEKYGLKTSGKSWKK